MSKLILVLSLSVAPAVATTPQPPEAREIAPDTYVVPGAVPADRGPDGNTVIITAPAGLIVIDTGRHPWHSDAILAFAAKRRQPIDTIINTHWHLDHSSGNRRLKAVHPAAKVHTTRAVDRALAPGGFLARSIAATRSKPLDPNMPPIRREETELFIATMDASDSLRPDIAIEQSGVQTIAGRPLSVRVATDGVTDADLWLYDEATRVAIIGDLVTLPAPFFETACPGGWQKALDEVWATPFRIAVPGHGAPMSRVGFDAYRGAFANFRTCVGSNAEPAACAAGWEKDIRSLLGSDAERKEALNYATYYVGLLRKNGGASQDCRAK